MIEFDEKEHKYTESESGLIIPSVTDILRYAGIVDYDKMPAFRRRMVMERGKTVHRLCEDYDLADEKKKESMRQDHAVNPYFSAYLKFLDETGFVPADIERLVICKQFGYCGRLDRTGNLPGSPAIVLDIKSGSLPDWTGIQTYAYGVARFGYPSTQPWDRYGLGLFKDGRYRLKKYDSDQDGATWFDALKKYKGV